MRKYKSRGSKPAGTSPGALIYIGEERTEPVSITRVRYSASHAEELSVIPVSECKREPGADHIDWFTIDGVHDLEVMQAIGNQFGLHPLVLEDILNTSQRPKVEEFDDYIFITIKMITFDSTDGELWIEHVSLILGDGYVLSFLENAGDVFEPVRQRIKTGKGRIRRLGADYLAYALIDTVVDNYFKTLEDLSEVIEELEEEVVGTPTKDTLRDVHNIKRQLISLRRSVWPVREATNALVRDELELIKPETRLFLRDLYDHTIHIIDTVETLREIVSGMLEVYLSSISNRLNEVMKVLTIMSSIFIPLTFIVGVYGMNFEHMPELKLEWGYPAVWVIMLAIAVGLLAAFRRRGWI
jgi:magnesium transporter